MKLYSAKVRLYGEVKDEVQMADITAAEVRVLRSIHGDDAVVDVQEAGNADRNEAQERHRLEGIYGEKTVASLFGAPIAQIGTELTADTPDAPVPELPIVDRRRRKQQVAENTTDAILE